MYSSTLSLTSTLYGVGGQRHAPAILPPGKTRYPLYRRLGGPQGRSGRVRKISSTPGFEPRTVQPSVAAWIIFLLCVKIAFPPCTRFPANYQATRLQCVRTLTLYTVERPLSLTRNNITIICKQLVGGGGPRDSTIGAPATP